MLKLGQNIKKNLFYFTGKNDIIGCYLDLDNLEIYYTKNGKDLGRAFSIPKHQGNQTFFPSVVLKNAEMFIMTFQLVSDLAYSCLPNRHPGGKFTEI